MFELEEAVAVDTAADTAAVAAKIERETPHTDLVRWTWTAVRAHSYARSLTAAEQEALVQQTLVQVCTADRNRDTHTADRPADFRRKPVAATRAADVLAWMAYAERTLSGLDTAATLPLAALNPRQRYGVLTTAVRTALESPHWQDHSARYRAAAKAQRDSGPRVVPAAGDSGDILERAAEAATAARDASPNVQLLAPIMDSDWSACDVARALAYEQGWTRAQARNVALALERARRVAVAEAGQRNTAAVTLLEAVAAQRRTAGRKSTVGSVSVEADRGCKLLRAVPVDSALRVMRHVARLDSGNGPLWDRVTVAAAAAADTAIRTHALAGGSWDADSIHSGRSLPSRADNTARTAGPWLLREQAPQPHRPDVGYVLPYVAPLSDAIRHRPLAEQHTAERKRSSVGGAIRRTARKPGPCRCDSGKRCPVHTAPATATVRGCTVPVVPLPSPCWTVPGNGWRALPSPMWAGC